MDTSWVHYHWELPYFLSFIRTRCSIILATPILNIYMNTITTGFWKFSVWWEPATFLIRVSIQEDAKQNRQKGISPWFLWNVYMRGRLATGHLGPWHFAITVKVINIVSLLRQMRYVWRLSHCHCASSLSPLFFRSSAMCTRDNHALLG